MRIQKAVRKWLSEIRLRRKSMKEWESKNRLFYDYNATLIQKTFRGYYERKYTHDFYSRQKYLQEILKKVRKYYLEHMI